MRIFIKHMKENNNSILGKILKRKSVNQEIYTHSRGPLSTKVIGGKYFSAEEIQEP